MLPAELAYAFESRWHLKEILKEGAVLAKVLERLDE
jgi:hypothetical protein